MKDSWTEDGDVYRVRVDWDGGSTFYGPYRKVGTAKAAVSREEARWSRWGTGSRTYTVQKMTGKWGDA